MEYPIPGWDGYCLTDNYEVVSYRRKRRVLKPVLNRPNPMSRRTELMFSLRKGGRTLHPRLHRIILAVKLGRWPDTWEQARHLDGDYNNNTFENIDVGCCLLNFIDDLDNGIRETTPDNIDIAIQRLTSLKATLLTNPA